MSVSVEPSDQILRSQGDITSSLGQKFSIRTTIDSDFIPVVGRGSRLYGYLADSGEGVNLLDMSCGIGVSPFGYNGELEMMPGNEWFNRSSVLLKMNLCGISPVSQPSKVFLSNSGTEAVEAAIKMCMARRRREAGEYVSRLKRRELLQKNVFGAFGGAFHGRTLGALSLNCSKKHHTENFFADCGDMSEGGKIKKRAMPVCHIPFPEVGNPEAQERFRAVIKKVNWRRMSAFFLELVQGEGGIRVINSDCLDALVNRCRDNGVYVVVDEVQTGMMRTGKMFACNHFGLEPDIICLSKALGGGRTAIGATVARAEFDFEMNGEHSNTFGGSPLPCKLALENIQKLEALNEIRADFDETIRILSQFAPEGLGLMRRIVFENATLRNRVCEKALHNGVLVIPAGERAIRLMPPLIIPHCDLLTAIGIVQRSIKEAKSWK